MRVQTTSFHVKEKVILVPKPLRGKVQSIKLKKRNHEDWLEITGPNESINLSFGDAQRLLRFALLSYHPSLQEGIDYKVTRITYGENIPRKWDLIVEIKNNLSARGFGTRKRDYEGYMMSVGKKDGSPITFQTWNDHGIANSILFMDRLKEEQVQAKIA